MLIAILIAILSNYFFPLSFSQKLNKVHHVEFIELILKKYNVDIIYYNEWKISKTKKSRNKKKIYSLFCKVEFQSKRRKNVSLIERKNGKTGWVKWMSIDILAVLRLSFAWIIIGLVTFSTGFIYFWSFEKILQLKLNCILQSKYPPFDHVLWHKITFYILTNHQNHLKFYCYIFNTLYFMKLFYFFVYYFDMRNEKIKRYIKRYDTDNSKQISYYQWTNFDYLI